MAAPIVHIEFRSSDFGRTAAFYSQLFEWQTQQNASATYMKFDGASGPSGGWVRTELVQAPGPIPYLMVDDLAAKMSEVEAAGGRILVGSMPFAGGGEVGLFADPDGNVVGLWMRKKGAGAAPEPAAPEKPDSSAKTAKPAKPAPKKSAEKVAPTKPTKKK
jgi:predicted enzyme related to lactoylglutathione lyase